MIIPYQLFVFTLITLFLSLGHAKPAFSEKHDQYPLAGNHRLLSCSQCHPDSSKPQRVDCISCHKVDIPNNTTCTICHYTVQNQYTNRHQSVHFGKHCHNCHGTANWIIVEDLKNRGQCISCHEKDRPQNHFLISECNLCHQEESWKQIRFKHRGFTSCHNCHRKPYSHKSAKCADCHDTEKWQNGTGLPWRKYFRWWYNLKG